MYKEERKMKWGRKCGEKETDKWQALNFSTDWKSCARDNINYFATGISHMWHNAKVRLETQRRWVKRAYILRKKQFQMEKKKYGMEKNEHREKKKNRIY